MQNNIRYLLRKYSYPLWASIWILTYLIGSLLYPKSMFYPITEDGFTLNIHHMDNNPFDIYALWYVHGLRYLVVYPFWWLSQHDYPLVWQNFLLLFYFTPLLLTKVNKVMAYLRFAILIMPFFLSFRTCLTVMSITILFFYITSSNNKGLPFFISGLFSNLSSGVVLPWLVIVFLYNKFIKVDRKVLSIITVILILSLSESVTHKIGFFSNIAGPATIEGPATEIGSTGFSVQNILINAISRNTVFMSFTDGRFDRFAVYIVLLFLLSFGWGFSFKRGFHTHKFFAIAIPGIIFEGLWFISFSLSVSIFISLLIWYRFIEKNDLFEFRY